MSIVELLDRWNEVFPPSLGEIGTPRAIASKLKTQAVHIEELKDQIKDLQNHQIIDMDGLKATMDSQLQSSRESIMNERRQLLFAHKTDINDMIERMEADKNKNDQEAKEVALHFKKQIDQMRSLSNFSLSNVASTCPQYIYIIYIYTPSHIYTHIYIYTHTQTILLVPSSLN